MPVCSDCGAQLPGEALYCHRCGAAISQDTTQDGAATRRSADYRPETSVAMSQVSSTESGPDEPLPVPENIAAVVAYITIIPAVVFLFVEPFKRNSFVRFHAFQHLLLWLAGLACAIAAVVLWTVLQLIPLMRVLVFPFAGLIGLAWFFVWLLLLVKAYRHEVFKLPVIGDMAEDWTVHGAPRWLGAD